MNCQWCGQECCNGLWVDCPLGLGEELPVVMEQLEEPYTMLLTDVAEDDLPFVNDEDFECAGDDWHEPTMGLHFWSKKDNRKENRMITEVFKQEMNLRGRKEELR